MKGRGLSSGWQGFDMSFLERWILRSWNSLTMTGSTSRTSDPQRISWRKCLPPDMRAKSQREKPSAAWLERASQDRGPPQSTRGCRAKFPAEPPMSVPEDYWTYDSQEKLDEAIADAKSYWISQGINPQAYTDEPWGNSLRSSRRPSKEQESRKMAGAPIREGSCFLSFLTANLRAIFGRSAKV